MKSLAAVLLLCSAAVFAHVCMLDPPQRGGAHSIVVNADPWCKLLTGPCGGFAPDSEGLVMYRVNETITVAFQKNQNHWNQANPGYFSLSFAPDPASPFTELSRVADTNSSDLALYEMQVVTPVVTDNGVLQVQYVTNQGSLVFYACSDVIINA